jgi:N-acetylglucosaminyldiphosphoundecaprenol N-acetyl-beta-D-mannosaminyltransferase
VDICGFPVRPIRQGELIDALIVHARRGIRTSAHYLNTHTFNLSRRDPAFREVLATSDLLYADGMSVVWAGRWLGHPIPERLSAADYFEAFCRRCAREQVALYFLGGVDGVSRSAADALAARIPGLRVAGTCGGYFAPDESRQIVERINASHADVLVVGMGSPQQESWVAHHREDIAVPVRWTVGALFDYFADREPRAPGWLCRCGGEWVYRLLHKPAERWRRYLVGNSRFAWAVMKAWATGDVNRRPARGRLARSGQD